MHSYEYNLYMWRRYKEWALRTPAAQPDVIAWLTLRALHYLKELIRQEDTLCQN